jgi:hypothetical protein
MRTKLSPMLASYFVATNAHDVDGMIFGFAEDAVVKDEGRQHRGRVAIRDWMRETIEKYDFKASPIESSRTGSKTVVLVSLSGKFPGSPITIQYEFTVEAQKIVGLEIG